MLYYVCSEDMLESLKRLKDVHGVPRILTPDRPEEFFEDIVDKSLSMLCTWSGELYLELHRGTYTTQFHVSIQHPFPVLLYIHVYVLWWQVRTYINYVYKFPSNLYS